MQGVWQIEGSEPQGGFQQQQIMHSSQAKSITTETPGTCPARPTGAVLVEPWKAVPMG